MKKDHGPVPLYKATPVALTFTATRWLFAQQLHETTRKLICLLQREDQEKKRGFVAAAAKYIFMSEPGRTSTSLIESSGTNIPYIMIDKVLENIPRQRPRFSAADEPHDGVKIQKPLYASGLSQVSIDKLENYYLMLIALDQNMKEHRRLRRTLSNTAKLMKILNDRSDSKTNDEERTKIRKEIRSLNSFNELKSSQSDKASV